MTSNESSRQQTYQKLRALTSARVQRLLGVTENDVAHLSLAALINILFLCVGDGGTIGSFNVSFAAALELVGTNLMWQEPEAKKDAGAQLVQ